MRKCSKCLIEKDLSEFYKHKAYKDGYKRQCKICEKEYRISNIERYKRQSKESYERRKNTEQYKKQQKEYLEQNRDKKKDYLKKYYKKNKENHSIKGQEYREKNKEKIKQYMKDRREKNKEKKKKLDKEYYEKNKERIDVNRLKFRQSEQGKLYKKIHKHKRRVSISGTDDGTINKQALDYLLNSQNRKCNMCDCFLDFDEKGFVHLDHIKPLVKGGLHTISNVQFLCIHCNSSKGAKYTCNSN